LKLLWHPCRPGYPGKAGTVREMEIAGAKAYGFATRSSIGGRLLYYEQPQNVPCESLSAFVGAFLMR